MTFADVDGFVYITDRFSDMVVSGGVNKVNKRALRAPYWARVDS